jgi:putative ABC transport system substrate-binding protein
MVGGGRHVIARLGAIALALVLGPIAVPAQQSIPVVGFLASATADLAQTKTGQAFRQGLGELGFIEGQNVLIEARGGTGRYEELPILAKELIDRPVSVLVAGGFPAARVVRASGTTIPSVFYMGSDPIELGVVSSLSRPGGTMTGITLLNTELGPKRLELLHQLMPHATSFALLVNPTNRNAEIQWRDMQAAADALKLQLHLVRASSEREFDAVFAAVARLRAGGIVIGADGIFVRHRERLGKLASQHAVPAIFQFPEFAVAGGLASYGGSLVSAFHQVGVYAGRILKGEKPADLPVQQSAKAELTINLKTAKALGITVPLPLLGRADEVIE